MKKLLQINPSDNCLVALKDLEPGSYEYDNNQQIDIIEKIPAKHKVTILDLPKGSIVKMYGVSVGTASTDIASGQLLTTQNLVHLADPATIQASNYHWTPPNNSSFKNSTFLGYHRNDGKVGTANYWLFIPLVFCENRNLRIIEETLNKALGYKKENDYLSYAKSLLGASSHEIETKTNQVFNNVDGIRFLYHDGGCGGTKKDAETLLRLLAGYLHHPNVAGATVLSLGCQHAQINWFKEIQDELYPHAEKPVIYLEQQQIKSEEALIKRAIHETIEQLKQVNTIERKPASLDKLVIGLECGGSDGFSGISANPVVGHVSDLINTLGGTTILSEFPELNGVEQNLVDRCTSRALAEKFLSLQIAYSEKAKSVGSGFDMNPSPGNVKDGLITDAIKSAGAAKKGGSAPINGILDYTEPTKSTGLNLLCTPGNDVESTTGMVGSGANLVLFTTGLGTPTGNPIAPVMKISSNTQLYESMNDIIDFDAGPIISGEKSIDELGEELLNSVIEVASGKPTKSMKLEQHDFILWKRGVSL